MPAGTPESAAWIPPAKPKPTVSMSDRVRGTEQKATKTTPTSDRLRETKQPTRVPAKNLFEPVQRRDETPPKKERRTQAENTPEAFKVKKETSLDREARQELYRLGESVTGPQMWESGQMRSSAPLNPTVGIGRVTPPLQDSSRPSPMIQPGVGPVSQLRSQAAHQYGMQPEAYRALRDTPVRLAPPGPGQETVGGEYDPRTNRIWINSRQPQSGQVPVLAHEQSHRWWDRSGFDNPVDEGTFGREYTNWRGQAEQDAVPSRVDATIGNRPDLYGEGVPPATERYAYTTEYANRDERAAMPDELKTYYSDFLQGMEPAPTPEPPAPPSLWLSLLGR